MLQRQSQDRRIPMAKLAESIIQTDELFEAQDQPSPPAVATVTPPFRAAARGIMWLTPADRCSLRGICLSRRSAFAGRDRESRPDLSVQLRQTAVRRSDVD